MVPLTHDNRLRTTKLRTRSIKEVYVIVLMWEYEYVLGVYDGEVLVDHWRIGTERNKTADEWGILFRDLFLFDKIDIKDFEE